MELKSIPDFEGYFAGDDGNIYTTLKQGCRDRYDLSKRIPPTKMNYRYTRKGYARVYLRRESTNKREDLYVHRIIAELFLDNPENKEQVNHINCIRDDNRPENLEWVTQIENYRHARSQGSLTRNKETGQYENKNKQQKV